MASSSSSSAAAPSPGSVSGGDDAARRDIARRFNTVIAALVVATLAVLGLYWWNLDRSIEQLRRTTLDDAADTAVTLAQAVGGRVDATVRSVDVVLDYLRKRPPAATPAFDGEARAAGATFPRGLLTQMSFIGADGQLAYSTLPGWRPIDLGDREHFLAHADGGPDRLFISRPLLGRMSNAWTVQFSRRVERDGRFGGVLVLSMSPLQLSAELAELGLHDGDVAALLRADGQFLARSVDAESYFGRQVRLDRPFLAPDAPLTGYFLDEGSFDKTRRLYAWRRLPEAGLIVTVGLSAPRVLANVERGVDSARRRGMVVTALFVGMGVALVLLLWRLKRRQIELVASAQFYRDLFERNLSVKLFVDAETGAIVDANAAACRFYGYSREQLLARRINDLNILSPEQIAREMDDARRERRRQFRFRHRLASGQLRDVEVYSGPIERDGRPLLYSIVHDVTDRRRLEERLRASEMRYRSMIEVLAEGVLVIGADGSLLASNAAARTLLNADDAALSDESYSLIGRDGAPLAHEDYPTRRALDLLASQGFVGVPQPGGGQRWLAVNTRRLPPELDGHVPGALVSFSDVTRVIDMEQEALKLTEARIAAEDASRAKSEFLANMSHEVRTPMNAVLGLLRQALGGRLDVRQRDLLVNAFAAANALMTLLDDLLDLSRIESGLFVVERKPFSLDAVLDGASGVIAPVCQHKGLEFRIRRAADVPDGLVGDALRLGQVLTNLLGNAVKFTERGGVSLLCELAPADALPDFPELPPAPADDPDAADVVPDRVRLSFVVIDTGLGMTDATVERLFRPFTQGDGSSTRRHGGSGIGLSITRRLVRRMGGAIDVATAPGMGATFTVTLDFGLADPLALPAPAPVAQAPAPIVAEPELAGRRVLLVEDNPLNQIVAGEMLRAQGMLFDLAQHGAEALDRLAEAEYDAVLMDVQMPVMDGYAATRELRRNPRLARLPVIAMTANAMVGDRERCLAAGMSDYLAKPVAPEALYATLRRQIAAADLNSGVDAG
ncbi:response regulator [Derxia lacustris]|uniref:response regulator n=1 Tax=Derxia lacustris TaxID=764842 RepID=UPI00111C68F2|nr:response regulator [Derxia lacustris]